jgi:hypothetical protein
MGPHFVPFIQEFSQSFAESPFSQGPGIEISVGIREID